MLENGQPTGDGQRIIHTDQHLKLRKESENLNTWVEVWVKLRSNLDSSTRIEWLRNRFLENDSSICGFLALAFDHFGPIPYPSTTRDPWRPPFPALDTVTPP